MAVEMDGDFLAKYGIESNQQSSQYVIFMV
jgi:hypothetical protein